jgi:hypothetical protein
MAANTAELPELLPNFRSHVLSGFEQKRQGGYRRQKSLNLSGASSV